MLLPALLELGAIGYIGALIFQFLPLPVEFDATKRALKQLKQLGLLNEEEMKGACDIAVRGHDLRRRCRLIRSLYPVFGDDRLPLGDQQTTASTASQVALSAQRVSRLKQGKEYYGTLREDAEQST